MSLTSVPLLGEEPLAFGEDDLSRGQSLRHPYVTFFHVGFKILAVITYVMCGWFSNSFITSFVVIVLVLSMDFWNTKNITGRLMVGLRWWNYVDDDGQSHWMFEAREKPQGQENSGNREARLFWVALIVTPLVWATFFIIALLSLKLKWLLLVMIALVLHGANLYGYLKCKVGSNKSLSSATSDFFQNQMLQNAMSYVVRQESKPQPARAGPTLNTV